MIEPLVGIALAAYKPNVEFLRCQLQSIADQSYSNWFCVIGFDSPLVEIKDEPTLQQFFSDARFHFIQNSRTLGLVGNFEATGVACLQRNPRYIAFSDQDDTWYPEKTSKLVAAIVECRPMSVVHCDMNIQMLQPDGKFELLPLTAWQLERRGIHNVTPLDFFIRNIAAGAGMLIDADLIRKFPKIPGDVFGQDHWYPLIAAFLGEVRALSEPLYAYRIHGNNVAGIGPYQGFFAASRASAQIGLFMKCLTAANSSRKRLLYARDVGLPVTRLQSLVVKWRFDLGFGYVVKAVAVIRKDKALARACLARALGKVFWLFRPDIKSTSR